MAQIGAEIEGGQKEIVNIARGGARRGDTELIRSQARELLAQDNVSISEMARRIGYSSANLSKFLSDDLENPDPVADALRAYIAKRETLGAEDKFVATRVAKIVMETMQHTIEDGLLTVLYGPPEIGKTEAVKEFLRRRLINGTGGRVAYYQVSSVDTTKSVLDAIARQLGVRENASVARMKDLVLPPLLRGGTMVVLDDAYFLSVKTLELFRWIWEHSNHCPLLLVGTETLMQRIFDAGMGGGRMAEDMQAFYSRVDIRESIQGGLSREERAEIARAHCPWMAKSEIAEIAEENLQPRRLVKVLRQLERRRKRNPAEVFQKLLAKAKEKVFQAA